MRAASRLRLGNRKGQATLEFALVYVGVLVPVIFAIIFTSQLLWTWHSINEWTRAGAHYAATHCWQGSGANVVAHMRSNIPVNVDQDQFQNGQADVEVLFYSRDPDSGQLIDFTCDSECSPSCTPEVVTVRVTNFEYRRFLNYLGIAPIAMPQFTMTVPVEGAGCDPEAGSCTP